jgi:hypothetical protein
MTAYIYRWLLTSCAICANYAAIHVEVGMVGLYPTVNNRNIDIERNINAVDPRDWTTIRPDAANTVRDNLLTPFPLGG